MKKRKSLVTIILIFTLLCNLVPAGALAETKINLNATDVTLYVLSDSYENLTIPAGFPQTFQIQVSGSASKAEYAVVEGDSVTVSDTGLVEPATTTWYWNGNIGSTGSSGLPGERVEVEYNLGESVVRVTVGKQTCDLHVTVENYASYYANQVVDQYIAANITSNMSDYEKLDKICAFVASYDYSPYSSSMTGMIAGGGGDCWASTSTILTMCEKVGLRAKQRTANRDPGAGSGHMNCIVLADEKLYIADAGYSEKAPRYYSIEEVDPSGCEFSRNADGSYSVFHYNGFDTNYTVPTEYRGQPVTSIDTMAFLDANEMISVTIPNGIKSIGASAFWGCENLTYITMSDTVETLGYSCFSYTPWAENQPDEVLHIGRFACGYKDGMTSAVIDQQGVTTINIGAFSNNYSLSSVTIGNGVTYIQEGAFYNCPSLKHVIIPATVQKIDNYAFGYYYANGENYVLDPDYVIYGYSGTAAESYAKENNIKFIDFNDPSQWVMGDASMDGKVTVTDVMFIRRYVAELIDEGAFNFMASDLNKDGKVTVADVMLIRLYVAELIDNFD